MSTAEIVGHAGAEDETIKISVANLTKTFAVKNKPPVVALDDISLTVGNGEFLSIVGPSGCGKTTLLRILAGLDRQTSGRITLRRQVDDTRPANAVVFQQQSAFPWLTVEENVSYGLRMARAPRSVIKEQTAYWVATTGLAAFKNAYPHQLSGGMKQRVAIARAFAYDADILFMDEPFAALDEQTKAVLQAELMRIWGDTGKTVVYITHSLDEAVSLSDRVLVMTSHPGRIKAAVQVPFERPRDVMALRKASGYGELVSYLWDLLRDEVGNAMADEAARIGS
ncbi:mannosyltransferase [Prauserella sp. PE36]|uniref:ABC transporter ATP-binding protein n=1 Tax=Prauserella sp. PE36 TaxID=1504709 RepID=UPI000DE28252|nr:ABC transporter ATP-binding protein [Prauserella sp. PE36]RBM17702.1 mannosyltransferase [Prauserella sp. PE36]